MPYLEALSAFFSTLDRLEIGEISGKILFKQKPDSNAVACLVQVRSDTLGAIFSEKESRITFADKYGNYRFRALYFNGAPALQYVNLFI